jgi:hypothetical protein
LGHPGVAGMTAKARQVLYWPGWSRDIAQHVQACVPCSLNAAAQPKPPFFFDEPPQFPGDHIAADHFQYQTENYLVLVDIFSGFPFLHKCHSPTAASLLTAVQTVFLQSGLPRVFLSDRGSAFMSQTFQTFLQECHVKHRISTPQYAQSNGAAERAVRTLKTLRAKCSTPFLLFQAIMELQNTPRAPGSLSPSEVFLGRRQRTWTRPVPRPSLVSWPTRAQQLSQRQVQAQQSAGRQPERPSVLLPGSKALLRNFFGKDVLVTILGYGEAPRAYRVQLPSGTVTERNRAFLFPIPRYQPPPTLTSPLTATTPNVSHVRPRSSPLLPSPSHPLTRSSPLLPSPSHPLTRTDDIVA